MRATVRALALARRMRELGHRPAALPPRRRPHTAVDPLLTFSALELARAIRAGTLSATEVVEAHIHRLEAVNPAINAVVRDRYQAARADARAADARSARARAAAPAPDGVTGADHEELPPLLGVPFTVKEMVSLEGMPHTFGSRTRSERQATVDAAVVKRLRAAGAIPLGVTNVPEWGFWFETDNLLYGRTRNPYDAARIVGGSSGGEAAAVGAGGAPFGIGSDIGGSVRMPAAFCGVFGHKPTHGLLPLTGHYPVYAEGPDAEIRKDIPWLTIGPLTRRAADLMPLLRIMAGPDGVDPNAEAIPLSEPEAVSWRGRRVLVLEDPRIRGAAPATTEVRRAVAAGARALAARGAVLEPLPRDFFRHALRIWFGCLHATAPMPISRLLGAGRPLRISLELLRLAGGGARFTFPALMFALMERVRHLDGATTRVLVEQGRRLGERLDALLGGPEGAVLLMPPHPRAAPRHRAPYLRPFDFAYTAALNVLRVPATVVPAGLDRRGLPLSVQVVAARGGDHLTIAAALALEEDLGGWRPPARLERASAR